MPRAAAYKMRFNLKDAKFDDKVIAKGDFDLQLLNGKGGYRDKIMTQVVPGCNGFYASVKYTTLPYAVVAIVKLTFTKIVEADSHQSESSQACIYGCISASSKLQQGNVISSVLLDKPPSDPLIVNLGKPIQLSRHVLAVPAYSSLEIKADLWDHLTNQQIATDVTLANFKAQDNNMKVEECILGQSYFVKVQICWNNVHGLLDDGRKPLVNLQFLHGERFYSTLSSRWSQAAEEESVKSSPIPYFSGSSLVEVFSINVFPDDADSRIYGTIYFNDHECLGGEHNTYYLFERDKLNTVYLCRDMKIKSIVWPKSPFLGPCFYMSFHLSDDMGRDVCCGYCIWNDLSCVDTRAWYGKLISSVIRDEHGYAIVHYAIFPNAVQAKVQIQVIPDDSQVRCMVSGSISAWYSKLYSTCSEKKFCVNTLLADGLQSIIFGDNVLKLQKSTFAMPVDSSLIIAIKLQIGVTSIESPLFSDIFDEVVDFEVDGCKPSFKSIPQEGYKVDLSIEWSKVDKMARMKCLKALEEHLRSIPDED